jgi:hypothetical protein
LVIVFCSSTSIPRRQPSAWLGFHEGDRGLLDAFTGNVHLCHLTRLPHALVDEARNATVALSGPPTRLTLARLVEDALRREVQRLRDTHNAGAPFPSRVMQNPFRDVPRETVVERTVTISLADLRSWLTHASYHVRLAVAIAALAPKLRLANVLALTCAYRAPAFATRAPSCSSRPRATMITTPSGPQANRWYR